MTRSRSIGVDVGGTKIAACLFDVPGGVVTASLRVPTPVDEGGPGVLDACTAAVAELAGGDTGVPVGVAVCELVDAGGAVTSAANFDWRGLDVAGSFPSAPVVVESDVRAAALAEARLGAGLGASSFVYLTVGTGISFSLVLDGVPHRGAHGNALVLGAPPVEDTASGAALARKAGVTSAHEAFGSPEHADVVAQGADELGRAMAWLVNALDPELLVVGGGLGLREDYRERAVAAMRDRIEAEASRDVPIVPASLGGDSAMIGAALLAYDGAQG